MPLLSPMKSNPKTAKQMKPFEGVILHLAPHTLANPRKSVCPWASKGCIASCLNTSGRSATTAEIGSDAMAMHPIHAARIRKTALFHSDRGEFLSQLDSELANLEKRAARKGKRPIARLNGTSDIPWERFGLIDSHPEVQFYDYTKGRQRAIASVHSDSFPSNYHLTYSRVETDSNRPLWSLHRSGVNIAVPFIDIPSDWNGIEVIDGTKHDHRFDDPIGVIVGLKALGRGKQDRSGFVIR